MAALMWLWPLLRVLVCVASNPPEYRATEVQVTGRLCKNDAKIKVGQPSNDWKRVIFPQNHRCEEENFECTLEFRPQVILSLYESICVDFSAMRIKGPTTSIVIRDGATEVLLNRMSEERYPLRMKYMTGRECVKGLDKVLTISFHAACDVALDHSFQGSLYVFTQSQTTGDIYFLGEGNLLKHNLKQNYITKKVTVRTHVWPDSSRGHGMQISNLTLDLIGLSYKSNHKICLEWNPHVSPRIPPGLSLLIYRSSYSGGYRNEKEVFLTLREGDRVGFSAVDPQCCFAYRQLDYMRIELRRDTSVAVSATSWRSSQLLFELVVDVDNEGDIVYKRTPGRHYDSGPRMDQSCACTYYGVPCRQDESVEVEGKEGEESLSEEPLSTWDKYSTHVLSGIFSLLGIGLLACCCYCCCCQDSKENTGQPASPSDDCRERGGGVPPPRAPRTHMDAELQPIMTPTRPAPSAPPPPFTDVYDPLRPALDNSAPPAYDDLFPDSQHRPV